MKNKKKEGELEVKLKERYGIFYSILENSPEGIMLLQEGVIKFFNRSILEQTGYNPEELKDKKFEYFIHPEDREMVYNNYKARLAGEDISPLYELKIIRKDGEIIPIVVNNTIINFEGEKVTLSFIRDITQSKHVEKKYKNLVEKAGIAILIDDEKGNFTYFNPRFCQIFGYSEDEIKTKSIDTLVHPDDVEYVMNLHEKRVNGKDVTSRYEFRGLTSDGQEIYLETDVVNLESGDKFKGTRSYIWDITERKKSEKKLEKNEEQLRNIFENSTNLFYSHTADHVLTYLSPQVETILGYTLAEALVKWTEFASDHPANETGFSNTLKAIETGERQPSYELQLVRRDGKKIWVEVREFPVVENGKTVSIAGSLTEITEKKRAEEALKHSEEQFRMIAENTGDNIGITTFDQKAEYLYVSPSIKYVLGFEPEDLLGKSFFDFVHPDDKKVLFKLLKSYLVMKVKKLLTGKEKQISETIEYRFRNQKGEWRDLQSTVTLVKEKLLAVTRDITDKKFSEKEIIRLKEGLEDEVTKKTLELREKISDLQRFVDATVERELRMKDLYEENEKLKTELKKNE